MVTRRNFWALPAELQLNDVVQCPGMASSPFGTAIVHKILGDSVTLYRPFAAGGDYSYSARDHNDVQGSQIGCMMSVESYNLWKPDVNKIWVLERRGLAGEERVADEHVRLHVEQHAYMAG